MGICNGRAVIVTGAGRGLGRAHALAFAAEGAKVVVNDIGVELDGSGGGEGPAHELVAEIEAMGGEAFANGADVSSWDQTKALVEQTVERCGDLHVVLNNAGIVRDQGAGHVSLGGSPEKTIRIDRGNIKTIEPLNVSLMPAGMDQVLTRQELADLIAYLEASR